MVPAGSRSAITALAAAIAVATTAACGANAGDPPRLESPEAAREAASPSRGLAGTTTPLRFVDATRTSGVSFQHVAGKTAERYAPEIMGGGVALVDLDRDGDPDLIALNGGDPTSGQRPADARDRVYLNDGSGRFEHAPEAWSLSSAGYGMGAAAGDIDGDGWTDLFLTTFGSGERILRNMEGRGFEDVTERSGIDNGGRWSTSAGFLDVEGDGDLDLLILNYTDYRLEDAVRCYLNDVHVYCTPEMYEPAANVLWINRGDGTFEGTPAGAAAVTGAGATGAAAAGGFDGAPPTRSLALVLGDVDRDGDTDAYIANDLDPNELWLGETGGLNESGRVRGVAYSATGAEEAGMGADMGDLDGDGRFDLLSANFQDETIGVYRQAEGMLFDEVSDAIGIGGPARARLSWGVAFFDAENDGDQDLLVANGHIYDNSATFVAAEGFAQTNSLFENLGGGQFADVSGVAGEALADRRVSRGLAIGDLDSDGRVDYAVANNDGPLQLALNQTPTEGGWIGLWLEGRGSDGSKAQGANRDAIGAVVEARVGGRTILGRVVGASSYLSVSDRRVHLGIGPADYADVRVYWPGGDTDDAAGLPAGAWYRWRQGAAPERFVPGQSSIGP